MKQGFNLSPEDPTVYTIIQDVYRSPDSATSSRNSGRPRPVLIFSAIYHFRYPASTRAPPPSIPPHLSYQPNSASFSHNTHPYPNMTNPIRPPPFQNSSMSPSFSDPGMFQSYDYSTQYRLDEPFRLDVNMDNFSLDDFVVNIDSPDAASNDMMAQSSSSSSFPKDIRNYVSTLTQLGCPLLTFFSIRSCKTIVHIIVISAPTVCSIFIIMGPPMGPDASRLDSPSCSLAFTRLRLKDAILICVLLASTGNSCRASCDASHLM